jgi:hypothetical protein
LQAKTYQALGDVGYGPQRRFAGLPQSFRSRKYTGVVAKIVKTTLMTHSVSFFGCRIEATVSRA